MARKRSRKHRRNSPRKRHHVRGYTARRRGRRTRVAAHMSNPGRRVRRRHRRNPGIPHSARGIMGKVFRGAKNGFYVFLGEAGTGLIAGFIPLGSTGIMGVVSRTVAATVSGIAVGLISAEAGAFALAGGFATVWRSLAQEFNVPVLSGAVAQANLPLGVTTPAVAPAGTAGYERAVGTGAYVGPQSVMSAGSI